MGRILWQNRHFSNQPYNAQSHKVTVIVTQNESDEKVAETLVFKETDLWKD